MGRDKPNRIRRDKPVKRIQPEDVESVEDFFSAMSQLAESAVQEATDSLLAAGAHQKDIDNLKNAMRAVCVSEIWTVDIDRLVKISSTHKRGSIFITDTLVDLILKGERG